MKKEMESAERIHTFYLFSVVQYCVDNSHKNEQAFSGEGLLERLRLGGSFSLEEIKSGFPKVWQRTISYANQNGLDSESPEAALGYWLFEHNRIIRNRIEEYKDMPEKQRNACMTYLAKVTKIGSIVLGTQKLEVVDDTGNTNVIVDFYHSDLKPGDCITYHEKIVCQKLTEKEYSSLLEKRRKYAA